MYNNWIVSPYSVVSTPVYIIKQNSKTTFEGIELCKDPWSPGRRPEPVTGGLLRY